MRTIENYYSEDHDFVHPLWLGILLLFMVVVIIGTLCCLRVKCGVQFCQLLSRWLGRTAEMNETSSIDEKSSSMRRSENWPSIYHSTRDQSPKLYTLVNNLRRAKLEKQLAIQYDENELEDNSLDQPRQISISASPDNTHNSEIARKFYASMRKTSQCQNSVSVDSGNNDVSMVHNTPSVNLDQRTCEGRVKLFRMPRFFKSIPHEARLVITI